MIARFLTHHTPRLHPATDPVVAAEQAIERSNAGLDGLPFHNLLAAQHTVWRRCLYRETRGKADLERFAGIAARLEREGASR